MSEQDLMARFFSIACNKAIVVYIRAIFPGGFRYNDIQFI